MQSQINFCYNVVWSINRQQDKGVMDTPLNDITVRPYPHTVYLRPSQFIQVGIQEALDCVSVETKRHQEFCMWW